MGANKKILFSMSVTAIFAALTFAAMFIQIPVGISKIHLANFVCVIAGLLCGGIIGGISGSLGMTLHDVFVGGYGPDTWIRTMIVKFILGLVAGYLFRFLIHKKKSTNGFYYSILGIFGVAFIAMLVLYILHGEAFTIGKYTFKNSIFLVVSLGIILAFYGVLTIFSHKLNKLQQYVLVVSAIALTLNVILEFLIKIPFKVWMANMTFEGAAMYATTSLPSALFTMVITIVATTFIYCPIYFATEKFNKVNDVYNDIQELSSWRSSHDEEVELE